MQRCLMGADTGEPEGAGSSRADTGQHTHGRFLLSLISHITHFYFDAENDESSTFLSFVCSNAMFRIQPAALPKPQLRPAPCGASEAASAPPEAGLEAGLEVGVGGGVRDMWHGSVFAFQLKVTVEVGVASGVRGRAPMSSSL